MTIKAQLPDGTFLEFEEGTPDEVIDQTVKKHLGISSAPSTGEPAKGEGAPEAPVATPMTDADKRKAYEAEVSAYIKSAAANKSFDASQLQSLASKYGMNVSNVQQIEDFYKKSGMLNPRVAYEDVNIPVAPTKPIVTEMGTAGEGANRARAFAKGALFDFADEAEAATRMLLSGELSADEYYKIKGQINYDYDKWAKANPGEALGLELGGGLAGTFIPGLGFIGRGYQAATGIGKIGSAALRSGLVGASSGVVSGIGAANTMGDIPTEALEQGITGGLVSSLLPGGGRLAMRGKDAVLRRLGRAGPTPDRVTVGAAEQINRALGDTSPETIAFMMQRGQKYGVPMELGMTTPEMARLTKAVISKPNEGREELVRTLAERQSEAPERFTEQVRAAFPDAQDYFTAQDAVTDRLRKIGEEGYEKSFAFGAVKDPTIQTLLKNPGVAGALKKAKETADIAANNAAARGEDPSKYMLKMEMEPVLDEAGTLVGLRPTGDIVPDVRTLHSIKRVLDEEITALYKAGDGGRAEKLKDTRDQILDRLDKIVPEYRQARRMYAGDLEVRKALENGRDAMSRSVRPQEVQKAFGKMSEAEKEAFRTGLMQRIIEPTEDTARSRNFAKEIMAKGNREKLRTVLPKEQFRVLDAALKREAELFERTSKTLGGSPTTPLAQDLASLDNSIATGDFDTVVSAVLNPTSPGNLARLGMWLASKVPGSKMSEKVYTKLAQALRTSDPQKLRGLLEEYRQAEAIAARNIKVEDVLSGRGAAAVGATAPAAVEDRSLQMPPSVSIEKPLVEEAPQEANGLTPALPAAQEEAEEGNAPFSDGKASVGERNNNPGNLIVSSWTKKLPGYIGPGEGKNEQGIPFAKFDTMSAGKEAKMTLIINKIKKGQNTPYSLIEGWLSPTNAANDPEAFNNYVKHVADKAGIGPNDKIPPDRIRRVAQGIYEFETGDRP